jgi:hypothetical protein
VVSSIFLTKEKKYVISFTFLPPPTFELFPMGLSIAMFDERKKIMSENFVYADSIKFTKYET